MPSDLAISAYRIIQSQLNILKHAGASKADLQLEMTEASLLVQSVTMAAVSIPEQMSAGIGLTGMRERCAILNGSLSLESQAGQRTQIRISLPIAWLFCIKLLGDRHRSFIWLRAEDFYRLWRQVLTKTINAFFLG